MLLKRWGFLIAFFITGPSVVAFHTAGIKYNIMLMITYTIIN